jgi:hypothetical protein
VPLCLMGPVTLACAAWRPRMSRRAFAEDGAV